MKRRWLGGREVNIQVALPALHLPVLSTLFIIDNAPLAHGPNTVLVSVRASSGVWFALLGCQQVTDSWGNPFS